MLAPSTRVSTTAKLKTITRALHAWGLPLYPPSTDSLRALGATLKRGVTVRPGSTHGATRWRHKDLAMRGQTCTTAR